MYLYDAIYIYILGMCLQNVCVCVYVFARRKLLILLDKVKIATIHYPGPLSDCDSDKLVCI